MARSEKARLDGRFELRPKLGCIILVLFAIGASAQEAEFKALQRDADRLLNHLHESGNFSGAVMIGVDGLVVYEAAYGMADRSRPFTPDSAADGASLAKTVTAAVIWRLIDDEEIALDDTVQEHLLEFPYKDVTIRHLLAHTAGLPDYDAMQSLLESGEAAGNAKLQEYMGATSSRPMHEPGSTFRYCNTCYDTLALLAERVTGASFDDIAIQEYLGSLGAIGAYLRPVRFEDWRRPRTLGFSSSLPDSEVVDVFDNEAFYGGSNIYFTVRDLHSWANAWAGKRALHTSTYKRALQPAQIGEHDSAISLSSWYCNAAKDRCYYTGHLQGFFNFVYWDVSRRLTVVFVSNNSMAPPLQPWFMRSLVSTAEGRSAEAMPALSQEDKEVDAAAVGGLYRVPGIGNVEIDLAEAGPIVRVNQGPIYNMYPVGFGILYVPGKDAYVGIETFDDNSAPRLTWSSVFLESEGRLFQH